jgi:hypothetical protein
MDIPGYLQILLINASSCYRINQNKMVTSDIIVVFDVSEQIFAKKHRVHWKKGAARNLRKVSRFETTLERFLRFV